MIESIEFKNFKALRDTTLPLGRFTLIVGPNGSGKSTALKAINPLKYAQPFRLNEVATAGLPFNNEAHIIINFSENSVLRWYWTQFSTGNIQARREGKNLSGEKLKLDNAAIYSLDEKAIIAPVSLHENIRLGENGSNLAGVLDQLRDNSPERFEELSNELARWLPEFDKVLFETNGGLRSFALRIKEGKHKIHARDLSQGVVLALTILTLAYIPDSPSIICLEEPDRGIHPRLLRDIQDALYRLAYPENYGEKREPVQVIATTHSPYFLDLFRDHPEEVVLANKTDEGTKFERLSDQPNLDEILEDSHLGEVWYTGILGGVPAHA